MGRCRRHQQPRAADRRWRNFVPESGFANTKGEWIIEGYGVDPDIEVDNDPKSVMDGKDPQLERGIAEIMARLKQPTRLPAKPAGPVKTIK